MMKSAIAAGALCVSLMAGATQAAVLVAFEETGGDIVGTVSGSLDLTGATFITTDVGTVAALAPTLAGFAGIGTADTYTGLSGPSTFGTGATVLGTGTGDVFGINGNAGAFAVPTGYTSGESLGGVITFLGTTFSDLGIIPGNYVFTLKNDTVTARFGPATAVVPLPTTLPLLLGALGLVFAATRRRT